MTKTEIYKLNFFLEEDKETHRRSYSLEWTVDEELQEGYSIPQNQEITGILKEVGRKRMNELYEGHKTYPRHISIETTIENPERITIEHYF